MPEAKRETCLECNGTGLWYYDEDGYRITIEHYCILPESERIADYCCICKGKGYVELQ
jgi:hypothetical protein